jgi:hypothetical protein
MGDYAIHLLFELSELEMGLAAKDFLALKNACASTAQTDGVPLGIHPCFSTEAALAKAPADFVLHNRLSGILGKYANHLVNAAVMGTDLGQDPWMFYPGIVKSGVFEPVRVFTVTRDPASAPIDSHGNKMRLPFDNARYQMLTLVMATDNDVANPIVPTSADARDSIVYSFQPPFSKAIGNPAKDPAAVALVQQALEKLATDTHGLEHPLRNDFFSVDCISCHTSTAQEYRLSRGSTVLKAHRVRFATQNDPAAFRSLTTTTTVSPEARQQGAGTVVNFAYRYNMPSVSRRVAYEASLSAAMLNRSFLSAPQKTAECAQPELETCLELLAAANPLSRSGPRLSLSSMDELTAGRKDAREVVAECKRLVCTEKSRLTELTATKSTTFTSGGLPATLPAGATLYAYVPPAVSSGLVGVTMASFRQATSQPLSRTTLDLAAFAIKR